MKTIRSIIALVSLSLGIISCSDSEDTIPLGENPLEGYHLLKSIAANGHELEIYTEQQGLYTGYNALFLRIKDQGSYVSGAQLRWNPLMHMIAMTHSCPKSEITASGDKTVYLGHIIFQMPGNAEEYWELNLDYSFGGKTFALSERLEVREPLDGNRTVNTFVGADDNRYVLALLPLVPKVAVNDISALLYKMENMMEFTPVVDHRITLDPRMPGMGNHSSPNNVDLVYDPALERYSGRLSLTMTGYWKINLTLLDSQDNLLAGEGLIGDIEASSLFFEVEF